MPGTIDRISLKFEDNGKFHNDLVLCVDQETWRCDSYYLLLDTGLLPEREDAAKVSAVLRRLLDQWHQIVDSLPDGGVCFLPYDFSDQYTGWLRCEVQGLNLLVQRGWAQIEGWSIVPSMVGELLKGVPGFRGDGPEYEISRREFLRSLEFREGTTEINSL